MGDGWPFMKTVNRQRPQACKFAALERLGKGQRRASDMCHIFLNQMDAVWPYSPGIANMKIIKNAKALAGGLLAGAQLLLCLGFLCG